MSQGDEATGRGQESQTVDHTFVHRWDSEPWSAVSPNKTVTELAATSCRRAPEKPLLLFDDGLTLTYGEFLERAERFAGYLRGRVSPGERVILVMDNRAEFMVACLAIVANRASFIAINPGAPEYDVRHILDSSQPMLAVVDGEKREFLTFLRESCPSLREIVEVTGNEPDGLPLVSPEERVRFEDAASQPEDIIGIWFTSGTTGLPKGCMVDHVWALRVTDVALRVHPYSAEDRIMYPVKFHYADAMLALLRALQCGGAYVAVRKFSVSRFWDIVHQFGVTVLSTIASMAVWLLKAERHPKERAHRVRFAIHADIPREIHEALDRRFGFLWLENYGMMECGVISRMPLHEAARMSGTGSVGPLVPEMAARIVGESGEVLGPGAVGEIVVQGPGMFRGYLNRPDATAELLRDGWLYTGDLGYADERGFLYLVGRKKEIIRRSGENISAAEVEQVLCSHDSILEAAVIPVPDVDRGEEVKAYIRLVDGLAPGALSPEEVVAFCVRKLAPHKVPRYIEFVASFPRTPSMRIRKEALKKQEGPVAGAWDRERRREG